MAQYRTVCCSIGSRDHTMFAKYWKCPWLSLCGSLGCCRLEHGRSSFLGPSRLGVFECSHLPEGCLGNPTAKTGVIVIRVSLPASIAFVNLEHGGGSNEKGIKSFRWCHIILCWWPFPNSAAHMVCVGYLFLGFILWTPFLNSDNLQPVFTMFFVGSQNCCSEEEENC